MTIPGWDTEEDAKAWDRLYVEGLMVPGNVTVSAAATTKVDVAKTPGTKGASSASPGPDPSTVSVDVVVWDSVDTVNLGVILEAVRPRGQYLAAIISAEHPTLAAMGITKLQITKVRAPVLRRRVLSWGFEAIEYVPPPPPAPIKPTVPKAKKGTASKASKSASYQCDAPKPWNPYSGNPQAPCPWDPPSNAAAAPPMTPLNAWTF